MYAEHGNQQQMELLSIYRCIRLEIIPVFLKVFWGAAIALMGYILLLSGGLDSVQHSVLVLGILVLIILLINAVSFIKATTQREKYDLTLTEAQKAMLRKEKELEG